MSLAALLASLLTAVRGTCSVPFSDVLFSPAVQLGDATTVTTMCFYATVHATIVHAESNKAFMSEIFT